MNTSYKVTTGGEMIRIQLFGLIGTEIVVSVQQTIYDKDFISAGNLIDRKTMPARICYILLKNFQQAVVKKIIEASEFIIDEDLKNQIITYTKGINKDEIEIVPIKMFEDLVKEVEAYSESLNKK